MRYSRRRVLGVLGVVGAAAAAVTAGATGWLFVLDKRGEPADRDSVIRAVFAPSAPAPALSPRHVALMRLLRVMWVPIESGAPGIDSEQPLIGAETMATARAALAGADELVVVRALAEVGLLLPAYVASLATLEAGPYTLPASERGQFADPASGVDAHGVFQLRREHLTLLRAAVWRQVDGDSIEEVLAYGPAYWPMPYIDGKRPYGDSSYYQIDMARLLGEPYRLDAKGDAVADDAKDQRLERLHNETLAALQVFLLNATLT
jgi:hypothetical protein